ncbi:MAG: hypothetical protein KF789_09515 [Bdellovibrionaceae bacterium]|nr:hypothetical protein [Pseudobdellovibrionaceae bacterium]
MENKKTVNQIKLQGLTDSQLIERIQKAPQKIEDKKSRLTAKIKELEQQIADYTKYRNDDLAACKKILEERQKSKAALPGGVTDVTPSN